MLLFLCPQTIFFSIALAEILSKREMPNGSTHYYVHYIDCEYEIICVLLKKKV